jgi:hypothetical protein
MNRLLQNLGLAAGSTPLMMMLEASLRTESPPIPTQSLSTAPHFPLSIFRNKLALLGLSLTHG